MTTNRHPIYVGNDYILNFNEPKYFYGYQAMKEMKENFEMDNFQVFPLFLDEDGKPDDIKMIEFTHYKDGEERIKLLWDAERSVGNKLCFRSHEHLKTKEMELLSGVCSSFGARCRPEDFTTREEQPSVHMSEIIAETGRRKKNNKKNN